MKTADLVGRSVTVKTADLVGRSVTENAEDLHMKVGESAAENPLKWKAERAGFFSSRSLFWPQTNTFL